MTALDRAPQHLDSRHSEADNTHAANLSREVNDLHAPKASQPGVGAGGHDSSSHSAVSQRDVDAIHRGFDGTAALYESNFGQATAKHGAADAGASAAMPLSSEAYSASLAAPDISKAQYIDSSGRTFGADSGGIDDKGSTYALKDGGSLSLHDNSKAQYTDSNGQIHDYSYYSNNDKGWHTMYKDSQSPREIADSMRQFRIDPEGGNSQHIDLSEPTYSAMHSSKLSPEEREFIDKQVPPGSKPLGMGIHRQAWQTPDDKAVVVGPNDPRPDAPFVLPPEHTVVSGNKKAETFPLGENKSISQGDVDKFVKDWADKGWEMRDNKISNFARTKDGKMWRVDPDDVFNWNQ